MLLGDTGDQFLDDHRLAQAGTAEQAGLATTTKGVSRSITLMPVSKISVLGDRSTKSADRGESGDAP